MGSIDVIFGELKAVTKRVVHMGLSCKVHDGVNGLRKEDEIDKISTGNVPLDELEVGRGSRWKQVFQIRTIIKLVQDHNLITRVVPNKPVADMGCNKAGSPSYENVLWCVCGSHSERLGNPARPRARSNPPALAIPQSCNSSTIMTTTRERKREGDLEIGRAHV